jgi:hypothetical protein
MSEEDRAAYNREVDERVAANNERAERRRNVTPIEVDPGAVEGLANLTHAEREARDAAEELDGANREANEGMEQMLSGT